VGNTAEKSDESCYWKRTLHLLVIVVELILSKSQPSKNVSYVNLRLEAWSKDWSILFQIKTSSWCNQIYCECWYATL